MKSDREAEIGLRGALSELPGNQHAYPRATDAVQFALDDQLREAFNAWVAEDDLGARAYGIPADYSFDATCVKLRSKLFVSRPHLCVAQVPVVPQQFATALREPTQLAVFSVIGATSASGTADSPATGDLIVSELADFVRAELLFSYDLTASGLLEANTSVDSNEDRPTVVHLVLVQWLQHIPFASGCAGQAKAVFDHVEVTGKFQVMPVACVSRPRWAFPVLGSVQQAAEFFRHPRLSKWNDDRPLLVYKFL